METALRRALKKERLWVGESFQSMRQAGPPRERKTVTKNQQVAPSSVAFTQAPAAFSTLPTFRRFVQLPRLFLKISQGEPLDARYRRCHARPRFSTSREHGDSPTPTSTWQLFTHGLPRTAVEERPAYYRPNVVRKETALRPMEL